MKIDALMMDEKDNVITCVREVKKGETVKYRNGDQECEITAEEDIPFCHKIALGDLEQDGVVIKYGEMIGRTLRPIKKGCLVDHTNIYSVPRDYESEMIREEK
ncbi:MAG TPA: UxaA family hydrolase [Candidatus Lachnoclostridium pullistercoris]|uniref:UxaA family hydrolase n=1 Tax=Candidatus Lachnoclostridium pullistercoris TaxID=2838632 RepID=A0A9D2PDN1_9FIRM|nr:UxaA family hydrolase [Candidatus Lachnoclostridium pullistercoris]